MLNFNVKYQTITKADDIKLVSDAQSYPEAVFNFLSDDWKGKTKTAIFKRVGASQAYTVVLTNDKCTIPSEVLAGGAGQMTVSVFGGSLMTCNKLTVDIYGSGYTSGTKPTPPTPDVYSQLTTKIDNYQAKTEDEISKFEAKVDGQVTEIKDDLSQIFDTISPSLMFGSVSESGTYIGTFAPTQGKLRMIPTDLLQANDNAKITIHNAMSNNAYVGFYFYDKNKKYLGNDLEKFVAVNDKYIYRVSMPNCCYIMLYVRKQYNAELTESDRTTMQENVKIEYLLDELFEYPSIYDSNTLIKLQNFIPSNFDISFGIQTDTHYSTNGTQDTLRNMKNLSAFNKALNYDFSINLGDVINGNVNKYYGKSSWIDVLKEYSTINDLLIAIGNHDDSSWYAYSNANRNPSEVITREWIANNVMSNCKFISRETSDLYYYKDVAGIRFITLNTVDVPNNIVNAEGKLIAVAQYNYGIRQEQIDWLIDVLSHTDSPVVIFSHISLNDASLNNREYVKGVLKAWKNGASYSISVTDGSAFLGQPVVINCAFSKSHDLIGNFSGHTHSDTMTSDELMTYVTTDSSSYAISNNASHRNSSDYTSDCIDSAYIDKTNRKVNLVRIGYGSNRSFIY